MSDKLAMLREKNPHIRLYPVTDPIFEEYGRVLRDAPVEQLHRALEGTPIPEQGNLYVASEPALEGTDFAPWVREAAFGKMDIQTGFCNGRGFQLNALEYHKCGEVNYTTTGCVLLMARQKDLKQGRLHSDDVAGFYLPPGVAVEVRPEVFHFAPCRVGGDGFRCLVVLEKGVNADLEAPGAVKTGEAALLWRQGKWLIAHPDSPQAELGACVAIDGENLQVKI